MWCKNCIKELEAITEIYEEWQEETNVKVIAISIDDSRNSSKLKPFVNSKGWEFELYHDPNSDFKRALGVNSVKFTGEVLKNIKMATYEINMKRILKKEGTAVGLADGILSADGKVIYKAENLKVGLFKS